MCIFGFRYFFDGRRFQYFEGQQCVFLFFEVLYYYVGIRYLFIYEYGKFIDFCYVFWQEFFIVDGEGFFCFLVE